MLGKRSHDKSTSDNNYSNRNDDNSSFKKRHNEDDNYADHKKIQTEDNSKGDFTNYPEISEKSQEVLKSKGFSISETDIERGLKNLPSNTGFYGRMQCIQESPLTILDVSHNYDGVQKTLHSVQKLTKGKLYLLYGTSSDKNYEEIISLFPDNCKINLCTFSSFRSLTVQQMEQLAEKMVPKPTVYTDVAHAISVIQSTANKEDTILVFGSFFLISDFFEKKSKKHL